MTENGNKPDENQVSRTSSSRSSKSSSALKPKRLIAFSLASCQFAKHVFSWIRSKERATEKARKPAFLTSSERATTHRSLFAMSFLSMLVSPFFGGKPGRNLMPPPQLTTDTPIPNVFEPLEPSLFVLGWNNFEVPVPHRFHGSLGHVITIHIPLWSNHWLQNISRTRT